jgi:hypothetical protein
LVDFNKRLQSCNEVSPDSRDLMAFSGGAGRRRQWRFCVVAGCLAVLTLLAFAGSRTARAATIGNVQTVPGMRELGGIACPSSSTCLAVGINVANTAGAIVPITNGSAGAVQSVAGTGELGGIACPSSSMCIAVGETELGVGVVVPVVNGTAGAVQTVPGTFVLDGVACTSGSACVAVGLNVSGGPMGVVVPITNGTAGAAQTVPGALSFSGVACPSNTCFAVGNSNGGIGIVVPIVNGTAGAVQTVPGTSQLLGIACPTGSTCLAVGIDPTNFVGVLCRSPMGRPALSRQ